MKISYKSLRRLIKLSETPEEVAMMLTQIGLEVAEIKAFQAIPPTVVVGKVIDVQPHPMADKLQIAQVDINASNLLNIVCGASNLSVEQYVPVATIGTILRDSEGRPWKIKKSKLRGVVSEGMICAQEELGLAANPEEKKGIMVLDPTHATVGMKLEEYLQITPDTIIEIELTPNRGDAISHWGVARDLAAYTGYPLADLPTKPLIPTDQQPLHLHVKDKSACPRYTAIILGGLSVGPSPAWLQNRLRAVGIEPINNVVDVTHLIMHKFGQPMHAYDYDQIANKKIIVQKVAHKPKFVTLDGVERCIDPNDLMIYDSDGPLCMAGVMGGQRAKVTEQTTRVLLESAYFDSSTLAQSARRHQLHTLSSYRFERGIDPNGCYRALQLAVDMVKEVVKGEIISAPIDYYPNKINAIEIPITFAYINQMIGEELSETTVLDLCKKLAVTVESLTDEGFIARVPTYRIGVTRKIDLIEEFLRIYGYDKVKVKPHLHGVYTSPSPEEEEIEFINKLADTLVAHGYYESKSNHLISSEQSSLLPPMDDPLSPIHLANPSSYKLDLLRPTLLFNAIEMTRHNLHRGIKCIDSFEIGKVYKHKEGNYQEEECMAIWTIGKEVVTWQTEKALQGVQRIYTPFTSALQYLGIKIKTLESTSHPYYDEAHAIQFSTGKKIVMGRVKRDILEQMDVKESLYFMEFPLHMILEQIPTEKLYKTLSCYPSVQRDISLFLPESTTYRSIEESILSLSQKEIQSIEIIDSYLDKKNKEKKSYTLRLTLQHMQKTFQEKEIEKIMSRVKKKLITQHAALVR